MRSSREANRPMQAELSLDHYRADPVSVRPFSRASALLVAIAAAGCGGGGAGRSAPAGHPVSTKAPAGSLVAVSSACENNGGMTLRPGSDRIYTAAVRGDAHAVCGCGG